MSPVAWMWTPSAALRAGAIESAGKESPAAIRSVLAHLNARSHGDFLHPGSFYPE